MKNILISINKIKQEIKKGSKILKIKKTNNNKELLDILRSEGLIQHYSLENNAYKMYLRPDKNNTNIIKQINIISKPSKIKRIEKKKNEYGINIILTNKNLNINKKGIAIAKII